MRRVIVSNLISLDGCYAGPNGEIDWFQYMADKDFEEYSVQLINSIDTMLFGRITYELMYSYWPGATTETDDQRIINAMNSYPKVVFSKTMKKAEWSNTTLISNNADEELRKLKSMPGKDMVIYGSGILVNYLSSKRLIDEYRMFVAPLILGQGKRMFNDIDRISLELTEQKKFKSGATLLHYNLKG